MRFLIILLAYTARAFAASIENCPGYTASNIVDADGTLTADLTLSGDACNIYSTDLPDLTLLVEYQTGVLSTSALYASLQQILNQF